MERKAEKINRRKKKNLLWIQHKKTWNFFRENLTEKNNYLPPDNFQEDRVPKLVSRTSPTNIGLAIIGSNFQL